MLSYTDALNKVGVSVPNHLEASAEVPVLTGPQAQGDLLVFPSAKTFADDEWETVTPKGVQVVVGEVTGNTHWLHCGFESTGVMWHRAPVDPDSVVIGYLKVPAGETAMLIHTDEHGANGVGPGTYAIHGKREQVKERARRVAD